MKKATTKLMCMPALMTIAACGSAPEAEQPNQPEEVAVDAYEVCGADGTRFASDQEALDAGLDMAQFGATMCPEYQMHPSWDADQDGLNDCYNDQSCDGSIDYTAPRPAE